ncbi:MAG TPA: cytochrome D ubiquinol oxidase subunit II, partial [Actinomycetota bacterium]|nr:cytochrome D ubiquinol oxidase subunit II [Actinomycetota bacterium]
GFISKDDLSLYKWCHHAEEAVEEIETFFRVYHSQRLVRDRLILRLNVMPDDATLAELSREFTDILGGPIERAEASPAEIKDMDVPDLPRIALKFDRHHVGRLRQLVDRLNEIGPEPASAPADKGPPEEV